jgi:hypothetical protein
MIGNLVTILFSFGLDAYTIYLRKLEALREYWAGKVYFVGSLYDVKLQADNMSVGMWFLRGLNRKQRIL